MLLKIIYTVLFSVIGSHAFAQYISKPEITFDFDSVKFVSGYAGSRLNEVAYNAKLNAYELKILPEYAKINPSPWYGFEVNKSTKYEITLILTFEGYEARYAPKITVDQINWTPYDNYEMQGESLNIILRPGSERMWVSANNLVDSNMTYAWMENVAASDKRVSLHNIGASFEGRPLKRMIIGNPKLEKVIMILGRQHPPEITGFFGLKYFIDENLNGSRKFKRFLKEYSLIVYPMVNPDGIDNGNWRFNQSDSAMDMNRDWGIFSQPESSQIVEDFENLVKSHNSEVVFSLDFHSTYYDILYLVTEEEGSLSKEFLDAFNAGLQEVGGTRHSTSSVNNGVYKNWFYHYFQAESITYEMGDDTSMQLIDEKGRLTANILREILK